MIPAPPNLTGYIGNPMAIALGKTGLYTDAAQSEIPMSGLIRANNVTYYNQVLQKDYGSRIWNTTPCPAGVVRALEMYPDTQSQNQRVYAFCKDGQVYKFPNYFTQVAITPVSGAPASLDHHNYTAMVVGGNELTNQPKKLFIWNGYDSPQIITGDGITRANISKPAADWTGTAQPFGAVIHRAQMWAWGNSNNPHQIYSSSATNHEDFQTNSAAFTYSVYPGEFDGIVACTVFRGRLYLLKYPLGVYYLVDTDADPGNWYFTKQSDDFGACSPQSTGVALNDLMVANNYGSLTSMLAALVFGDVLASDIFHKQACYRFANNEVRADIVSSRSMIYYSQKQRLMVSFQSNVGSSPDRIASIDFKNPDGVPKISWSDKDQANCLFMVRDNFKIPRPFYGSNDGNLYQMDIEDRWVGSETDTTNQKAYLFDAQTPHMDMSQGNPVLGAQVKSFDFLEIEYEPTGNWNCNVDVFIDGRFQKTYLVDLSARSNLSEMPLNSSVVDGLAGFYRRFKIHGQGRTISLRFYNDGLGEDVRLVRAIVYFQVTGQQQLG